MAGSSIASMPPHPAGTNLVVLAGRRLPPESDQASEHGTRSTQTMATYQRSGLRFAVGSLESSEALTKELRSAGVHPGRCVNAEISLQQAHFASMAVVEVQPNSKTAVLLITSIVNDAQLQDLVELVQAKGWSLPQTAGPQCWLVTPQIAVSVSQGHLGTTAITCGKVDNATHLWQSVVNLTDWAVQNNANDIDYILNEHDETSQVAFKVNGQYVRPERWRIPTQTMQQMLQVSWQHSKGGGDASFQLVAEQQSILTIDLPSGQKVRLRWSGMATDKGTVITQRIQLLGQSQTLRTLEQAGCLPWHVDTFNRVLLSRGGITTLAGEVGSGKSNTLALLMRLIPDHFKIIEISSPVEIDLGSKAHQKTIIQDLMKTGADARFAAAIRAIFRSALDKLLIGEIRDWETGMLARAITESGHSVFTTTHAPSALGIYAKYISPQVGIPLEVLAAVGNVRLNVFQALLPKLCSCSHTLAQHCERHPHEYDAQQVWFDRIESLYNLPRERFRLRNAQGCHLCQNPDLPMFNGRAGRTLVMEMVEPDQQMCELLQKNDQVGLLRYWRSLASPTFDDPMLAGKTAMECAIYKAQAGQIDLRDVQAHFESFQSVQYQRERQRAQAGR